MMSTFSTFLHKTKAAANIATKKTGNAVELSKLKLKAMQLRSQIQSTYERIGTLTYEQEKTSTDNTELIAVCIREIDELFVELNEINVLISDIKDGVKCPGCNAINDAGVVYCKNCGVNIKRAREGVSAESKSE
ncbi:MAG: hypothetical protein J6A76_04190 [Oscillospiraceae bacterium]|nr:hypothetical protein [Oscillospiraceae bacterium]